MQLDQMKRREFVALLGGANGHFDSIGLSEQDLTHCMLAFADEAAATITAL
jgi:hypothetical protein